MMSFIAWIVFGVIVGALARLITPGTQSMGILLTCGLGIAGSVLGGLIAWAFRGAPQGNYDPAGWIMSILGAIVLLLLFGNFRHRRVSGL